MTFDEILAAIDDAFQCERPAHLGRDPDHTRDCPECAEHNETMEPLTPLTVDFEAVGTEAWHPLHFLSDDAFKYFMPGLARLATGTGERYFLSQLLFQLESGRVDAFVAAQCRAVAALLDQLYETMAGEIEDNMDADILGSAMDRLAARLTDL